MAMEDVFPREAVSEPTRTSHPLTKPAGAPPTKSATDSPDPMDDQPIRCELEMDAFGLITLTRGPGCTLMDALDLCVHIVSGGYRVLDITPTAPDQKATATDRDGRRHLPPAQSGEFSGNGPNL